MAVGRFTIPGGGVYEPARAISPLIELGAYEALGMNRRQPSKLLRRSSPKYPARCPPTLFHPEWRRNTAKLCTWSWGRISSVSGCEFMELANTP